MIFGLTAEQLRALAGGFVCMLIYGSSYTYGTVVPYMFSYIYYYGDQGITLNQMAILLPISIVVLNFGMPLNNIPQLQFSNRITTLISILGVCAAIFIISFSNQFWQITLLYGVVFGLFIGYGYLAPIKNCYEHIPQRKGLCSGMCILGYGIASLLFNFILLKIINPHNEKMIEGKGGKMVFSRQVADNYPFAMRIMAAVYLAIGLLGIFLMRPPTEKGEAIVTQQVDQKSSTISKEDEISQHPYKNHEKLTSFILRKKIHFLTLTLTCSVPFGMFVAFNYKEYGNTKIDDDGFLTAVGSSGAIFNGLGRLLFGMLFDKFSFRLLSSIINFILVVFSLTLSFLVQSEYMYLVAVSMIYFVYGANYSIYPTQTVRVFGNKIGPKVYYIVFLGFSLACIIQYLSRLFLVQEGRKYEGFRICFFIFAGFNVVSFFLSLFVKYDYQEDTNLQVKDQTAK